MCSILVPNQGSNAPALATFDHQGSPVQKQFKISLHMFLLLSSPVSYAFMRSMLIEQLPLHTIFSTV